MDRRTAARLDPATPFLTDPAAQAVCALLTDAGHVALFVGGCVRNAILGVAAGDIDIATDALPDTVIHLAGKAGLRAIPTGIEHGTVTLVVSDVPFEVTTFRRDVATDGRRAVVAFSTDMAEDARRRDFTMNALYADAAGTIIDPLGGLPDLRARRVRFIEDAGARIREDYLRALRFFRFHAWYGDPAQGWDSDALSGIADNLDGLDTLSAERVGAEMIKLLSSPDPAPALAVMAQVGVLARLLPGADPVLMAPLVHAEGLAKVAPDPMTRLAALGGEDAATRLRLSRADARVFDTVRSHGVDGPGPRALGHVAGLRAGIGAILLRAALTNRAPEPNAISDIEIGVRAKFPIKASDLPLLEGKALGDRLAALKAEWLASNLEKSKNDLLGS